jgi:hypothetical protein
LAIRYRLYQWTLWTCIFLLSSMLSCSKSTDSPSDSEGELYIKLIDVPQNYEQVNINIVYVAIHNTGTSEPFGWSIVSTNSVGPINLLLLRNGNSAKLLQEKVPVGKYDKVKLRFGTCTIYDPLENLLNFYTPLQEHILVYDFEILGGEKTQLTFDFDVPRSVIQTGISTYSLKPVIRVQNTLLSGSIAGSIIDSDSRVVPSTIFTETETDTVSTLNDASTGSFQLSDIPEGIYSIRLVPSDTLLFKKMTIGGVVVVKQTKNNLGVITLESQ